MLIIITKKFITSSSSSLHRSSLVTHDVIAQFYHFWRVTKSKHYKSPHNIIAFKMGIQGLIPFCEQATTQTTILKFRGKCVAVDSYCFLHRGAYSCADKLVKGIKTSAHIDYCMKYVSMLLSFNIKPIMVFDGR